MKKNFIQSFIAFFLYVFAANTGYCEIRIPFNDNWKFQLGDRPNGNIVPTFDGIFDLTAEDCEIIGIDNGNQYDPDGVKYSSFSRGSFHNGKAGQAEITVHLLNPGEWNVKIQAYSLTSRKMKKSRSRTPRICERKIFTLELKASAEALVARRRK